MPLCFRVLRIAVAVLVASTNARACLWIHGTTIDGHYTKTEKGDYARWLKARIAENPGENESFFAPFEYHPYDPLAALNDDAVQVLLKGDAARAVTMLHEIEARQPGQYYTAANLGTAYELAGDDVKALEWIKEGIRRNPESHMLTEWLHASILEAKIHLKTDPDWLKSRTVTGADFTRLKDPNYVLPTLQRPVSADDLRRSLRTQLGVRTLFVKPKDVIVAHLLRELALAEAQAGLLEQATGFLDLAELYGLDPALMAAERIAWAKTIRNTPRLTDSELRERRLLQLAFGAPFLLLGAIWAIKIWRKRHSRTLASAPTS